MLSNKDLIYFSKKGNTKPWMNADVEAELKKRQHYFRVFKQGLMARREFNNFTLKTSSMTFKKVL